MRRRVRGHPRPCLAAPGHAAARLAVNVLREKLVEALLPCTHPRPVRMSAVAVARAVPSRRVCVRDSGARTHSSSTSDAEARPARRAPPRWRSLLGREGSFSKGK